MEIQDLYVDWNKTLHNTKDGTLIAVGIKDIFEFDKIKKRFTENVIGFNLTVVDSLNAFSKSNIRIETNEEAPYEIQEAIESQEYCSVFLHGLRGRIYKDFSNNEIKFAISADAVEVIN